MRENRQENILKNKQYQQSSEAKQTEKMRLWKRASGVLKDRNSILVARLARRTAYRHPGVESSVIKATSHDDKYVDYEAAGVVFRLINTSPVCFRAFLWALCNRMDRTRSWVVALKGIILMHGALGCKTPAVKTIGRLPFDLSNFHDGHGSPWKMWGFNAFVRAYYAFVDHKSALLFSYFQEQKVVSKFRIAEHERGSPVSQSLLWLQKLQGLLDLLLQIKPQADGMMKLLILEAMDCVVIDLYEIYSRICSGIAKVLLKICSAGRTEALIALKILHKSKEQGEELSLYIELCQEMGVTNAMQCPEVEQVPEEDFRVVERIISGVSEMSDVDCSVSETGKAVAVIENPLVDGDGDSNGNLKTIITNEWEVFDEDLIKFSGEIVRDMGRRTDGEEDPLAASLIPVPHPSYCKNEELPDLITFL